MSFGGGLILFYYSENNIFKMDNYLCNNNRTNI